MTTTPIRRALISVSDKTGIVELAKYLASTGTELVSTGGTSKALREAGLDVKDVSDITGFPEMMDGRVKTLHPAVHGGILFDRSKPSHQADLDSQNFAPIDLVVINLYPFAQTVAGGADYATCVENIDIGGPTMIRSAAKNHAGVTVITDPADYDDFIEILKQNDNMVPEKTRKVFALRAFTHTAVYDSTISNWLSKQQGHEYPATFTYVAKDGTTLRYGENPHQSAAVYSHGRGVAGADVMQGKALSYNNYADASAAWNIVKEFQDPACIIIKHANPCGSAVDESVSAAYSRALECDSKSAFGGIVAVNREVTADLAEKLVKHFLEVVIAPSIDDQAATILAQKKNLRVLIVTESDELAPREPDLVLKTISGGLLVQQQDYKGVEDLELTFPTERKPTEEELADMKFAWSVGKHVKSNAIVVAKGKRTLGVGAGQMSRVDSAALSLKKAAEMAEAIGQDNAELLSGSVASSDAFLPFADTLEILVNGGVKCLIQPGGSINDEEVIKVANDLGVAMVFTGIRHFNH